MDLFSRLVEAGIRPDCALETIARFRGQANDHDLEKYVQTVEERHANYVRVLQSQSL